MPGLWAVVQAHDPLVRCWPFQLGTQGFTHSFFNNLQALPGDRGKGTPWSAVAGRFEVGDRQLLAGLICVADRPNSLSQMTVAHVGQWLDVLRVRGCRPDYPPANPIDLGVGLGSKDPRQSLDGNAFGRRSKRLCVGGFLDNTVFLFGL